MSAPFSNPSTSAAAARAAGASASKREVVREAVTSNPPGLTANEVVEATGLGVQTVTARVRGMVLDGTLVDTGIKRPSRPGSKLLAIVWGPNLSGRRPAERSPQTHGRLAAAVSREREAWRSRVAIALSALEAIATKADVALVADYHNRGQRLREIRDRASEAARQVRAPQEPPPVSTR